MLTRTLITPRLRLEATVAEHADGLWAATNASMHELLIFMAWAPQASPENSRAYAERTEQRFEQTVDWGFTIFHEGEVAGSIALMNYEALNRVAEIGYWIRSDLAGRGLMAEAARAVCEFGFAEAGLHRIELKAWTENPASIRIAEKLGFTREGLLREASWAQAGFQDMYIYGLLESEWKPKH
jgi:ribosomal-protein-serine acetyltransferase